MHGITRCPSCDTAFNVAHKQLARAKGRVRCGVCKHTFSAADYWVVAELDEAELDFERPAIDLQHRKPSVWRGIVAAAALSLGAIAGLAQWFHHHPADIQAWPKLEPLRQWSYQQLGMRAPLAIDWPALSLGHYVAQPSSENSELLRIQGLLINQSQYPQPVPDLTLTLWLQSGEQLSQRIPAQRIIRKADRLAARRQSQFYVDIEQRSEDIERFSLALCCQQK